MTTQTQPLPSDVAPVAEADAVTDDDLDDTKPLDLAGARRLRAEAARRRVAAKDAEERIEALTARVAAHERADITRLAEQANFARPDDLFDLGLISLDDESLRTEDGALDTTAVSSLLGAIEQERKHLVIPRGTAQFDQGNTASAPDPSGASWSTAFGR